MGLWNWIQTQVTGIDIAAEKARSEADNAIIAAQTQALVDAGKLTKENAVIAEQHYASEQAPATYQQSVNDAFVEGAKEGLANEQQAVKGAITSVTGGILGFVPGWLWIVAAVVVFFYFGGGIWLSRQFKSNQ